VRSLWNEARIGAFTTALFAVSVGVLGIVSTGGSAQASTASQGSSCPLSGVGTHPSPPARLSPLSMSPAQLTEYGFPPRPPTTSQLYQGWESAMAHAATRVVPTLSCSDIYAGSTPATSPNWSGYVAYGTASYGAQTTFVVPSSSGVSLLGTDYASIWAGSGGFFTGCSSDPCAHELVQAGVEENESGTTVSLNAWFEIYPMESEVAVGGISISEGNTFYVNVNTGSPNEFFLENETNGQYSSVSQYFASGDSCGCDSGEAILERPTVNGSYANLTPLNPTNFSNAGSVTPNGDMYLVALNNYDVTMQSGGTVYATPGPISNGNFTVTESDPLLGL